MDGPGGVSLLRGRRFVSVHVEADKLDLGRFAAVILCNDLYGAIAAAMEPEIIDFANFCAHSWSLFRRLHQALIQ
jgi:hypothetical protein